MIYEGLPKGMRPCSTSFGFITTRQVDVHTQHHTKMIAKLEPGQAYIFVADTAEDIFCDISECNRITKELALAGRKLIVWAKGTKEDS